MTSTGRLNVPSEWLPDIANKCECDKRTISAVSAGLALSMRRDDRNKVIASLSVDLEYCIRVYCGATADINEEVIEESVDFCLKRFAHLGVDEIREAFSMAAAGELGEIDLAAYHGRFTIKILGEVLRSYSSFREKVVNELRRAENEAAEAAAAAEKLRKSDELLVKHMNWCAEKLNSYMNEGTPEVNIIPVTLYEYLDSTGLIEHTKAEKWVLMGRAVPIIRRGLMGDISTENNEFRKRRIRTIIAEMDKGKMGDFVRARQKVAARQLAVHDWVNAYRSVIIGLTSLVKSTNNADAA